MIELLSYQFVQYAIVAGVFVAIICSLTGITVLTRNMSILGDSLSHVAFASATIALFFGLPVFFVALPVSIIGAYFISELSKDSQTKTEAYVAAISSFSIAIGVLVASQTKHIVVDLDSFLFGAILTIQIIDLWFLAASTLVVVILFALNYRNIFLVLFDQEYAKATGINTDLYFRAMSIVTGIVIALSMKVVGALLVSALLVLPAFAAFKLAKSFVMSIYLSLVLALVSVFVGILLSLSFDLPTGASIAMISGVIFFLSLMVAKRI